MYCEMVLYMHTVACTAVEELPGLAGKEIDAFALEWANRDPSDERSVFSKGSHSKSYIANKDNGQVLHAPRAPDTFRGPGACPKRHPRILCSRSLTMLKTDGVQGNIFEYFNGRPLVSSLELCVPCLRLESGISMRRDLGILPSVLTLIIH